MRQVFVRAFGLRERERFADARGVVTDVVLELDGVLVYVEDWEAHHARAKAAAPSS